MEVYTQQKNQDDFFFTKSQRRIIKIYFRDILYIKGYGDYMRVFCDENSFMIHTTMTYLENFLPKEEFFRTHRSFIVKVDKIGELGGNFVKIEEQSIPLSRAKRKDLISILPIIE